MKEIEVDPGMSIDAAARLMLEAVAKDGADVFCTFNEICVPATKGSTVESICEEYSRLCEVRRQEYLASPEYAEDVKRRAEQEAAERQRFADTVEMLKTADEGAMREIDVPFPRTREELMCLFDALATRQHDYGTCVYAMSIVAQAAFNLMSSELGCTGFQASCADLDVLRRTRGIKGPFSLIDGSNMLYPQYDLRGKVEELLDKWRPWAAEQAAKLLETKSEAAPSVIAHWRMLSGQ